MYCIVSNLIICIGNDETKSIGLELLKSLVEFCIYLSRFVIIFSIKFFCSGICNKPYLSCSYLSSQSRDFIMMGHYFI